MATPSSLPDGLVLSGGAGRRVGGQDKGLLPGTGDVSAAEEALALLRRSCGRVFISANRNLDRYRAMDSDGVVEDLRPGYPGPLAGLEAARAVLRGDRLLLLPCDTPDIPRSLPQRLLAALDADTSLDLVHACAAGRDQFLVAALHRRALEHVGVVLDEGNGAVRDWLGTLSTAKLHLEEGEGAALVNRNRSADWRVPRP